MMCGVAGLFPTLSLQATCAFSVLCSVRTSSVSEVFEASSASVVFKASSASVVFEASSAYVVFEASSASVVFEQVVPL